MSSQETENKKEANEVSNNSTSEQLTDSSKNDVTGAAPSVSPIPAWVNQEHFVDIVKANVENFEKITNFNAIPAMKPGENYATLMLRVSIDVQLKDNSNQKISFMLKIAHENEQMMQMLALNNFFDIENGMYFEIFPELESMYKDAGVDISFAPKAYQLSKDIGAFNVLLQDLQPQGYKNANRLQGLNMEHTELVLKKLAKFHAASATRVANKGYFPEIFMKGFFSDKTKAIMEPMLQAFSVPLIANMGLYKNGELYMKKMEQHYKNIMKEIEYILQDEVNDFCVLNHGDCWCNNILFKYDEQGKVQDLIFIDFQGPRFGTPVTDLYYFIMTSCSMDIKLKEFDYFIRFYHDNLIENLKLLKYPKPLPTLRQLQIQTYKYGTFGLMSACGTLPAALLDSTDTANFENFLGEDENGLKFKNLLYTNKRYIKQMDEIFPWFYNRGAMDNLA